MEEKNGELSSQVRSASSETKIYEWTLRVFTPEHQIIVMIEEMAELTKELVKTLRDKKNISHLLEEMADVEIVLEQMKLVFGPIDYFYAKKKKLERLEKRLENGDIEALK